MLPLKLLQLLACPTCKGELMQGADDMSLQCKLCCRVYPIVEGIPVLLPEHSDAVFSTHREAL